MADGKINNEMHWIQVKYIRTSANRPDAEELRLADRMKALLNFTSNVNYYSPHFMLIYLMRRLTIQFQFTLTSTELRCASAETLEPFIYEFIWVINDDRFKLVRECEQVSR